jgi:hypothetical protein
MAAIDFPNSPTVGQLFTVGDITWEWTGTLWKGFTGFTTAHSPDANSQIFTLMGA